MLNPALEDHAGGDLGYLNSLFNGLLCFGQEPTPDIRKKNYFWRFGVARWPSLGTHWLQYMYIYIYIPLTS